MRSYFKSFLVSLCLHGLLFGGGVLVAFAVETLFGSAVGSGQVGESGSSYNGIMADLSAFAVHEKPMHVQGASNESQSPSNDAVADESAVRLGKKTSKLATKKQQQTMRQKHRARPVEQLSVNATERVSENVGQFPPEASLGTSIVGGHGLELAGGSNESPSEGDNGSTYLHTNYRQIRLLIQKKLEYPVQAKRQGWHGRASFSFTVEKSGVVMDIKVINSCGYRILDEAGVRAIKAASPLPPPHGRVHITLPIDFAVHY